MLINDKEAAARLTSPLNLINRLKDSTSRKSAMSLFIPSAKAEKKDFNPFIPQKNEQPDESLAKLEKREEETPILDNILVNHESQIQLGLAHDNALKLLNAATSMLSTKLDEVSAAKLPAVISAASKTVESIRRERNESKKNDKDKEVHYHFYTPQQNKLTDYEVIEVS